MTEDVAHRRREWKGECRYLGPGDEQGRTCLGEGTESGTKHGQKLLVTELDRPVSREPSACYWRWGVKGNVMDAGRREGRSAFHFQLGATVDKGQEEGLNGAQARRKTGGTERDGERNTGERDLQGGRRRRDENCGQGKGRRRRGRGEEVLKCWAAASRGEACRPFVASGGE
ncbi:hypothetical protein TRVL_06738 [Trypanosoma vivax]|nr:hypothetical protein TRVL_06738 [Trypanosoma vivax]